MCKPLPIMIMFAEQGRQYWLVNVAKETLAVANDTDEGLSLLKKVRKDFQIRAARRALSLVNSLGGSAFKARHTSRIFSNLNRLRAAA